MIEVIPAILAQSKEHFVSCLRAVEHDAPVVHIDVLDGTLFPHMSWADAAAIGALNTPVKFELHLMVENPLLVVEEWKKEVPGLMRAIFHAELDRPHGAIVERLHWLKLEAGIALNPETPVEEVHHDVGELDELLLMTVHPGAAGQGIGDTIHALHEEELLAKVREIHARYPNLLLGCDGGMDARTIPLFAKAGARRLCAGSAIFQAKNPIEAFRNLVTLGAVL